MKKRSLFNFKLLVYIISSLFLFIISVIALVGMVQAADIHIHSIDELNQKQHSPDSHEGMIDRSTLEIDFRSQQLLGKDVLGVGTAHYPRLKKLADGTYIMFYNAKRASPDCLYITSTDLRNWSEPNSIFKSDDTYSYATCDAVVLSNGDILCCAAKRPFSWEAYKTNMDSSSLVIKRSSDNGKTWSEEKTVYNGMVWEPCLLELDTGEIQIYFTHAAPYTYLYGYNDDVRSTGSAIIRSYDGGNTWTPDVNGHNINPDDPYAAWRVMQQQIGSFTVTDPITNSTVEKPWFNDQMPVAIQLNNGSIAMAVESYLHFAPHPINDGYYQISIGFSYDNWARPLGREEEGPADKLLNLDRGAGPYLAQFPSGEVILSHTDNTTKIEYKIGDTTAHNFSQDFKINTGASTLWSSSEIISGHKIAMVSDDGNKTADVEAETMEIGYAELVLNHNITANNQITSLDGNNAEWKNNTEALFIGSISQAQASVRSGYDDSYVYFLVEILDEYLSSSDSFELYFAGDETNSNAYSVKFNTKGVVSKSYGYSVDASVYVGGTVDKDTDTDTGYIIEIRLKKSNLQNIGFTDHLYVLPRLNNTDKDQTFTYDSITGANIKTEDKTLCPMITYTGINRYNKIYVSSSGNDMNLGNTQNEPLKTLARAISAIEGDGEIVILSDITLSSDLHIKTEGKSLKISGLTGKEKINSSANIYSYVDLTIDNIAIHNTKTTLFIYMQYNDLVIGDNVTCSKSVSSYTMYSIIGGYYSTSQSKYADVCSDEDCTIEVNSGRWRYIRGGNRRNGTAAPLGHYSGNTTITINGGIFEATSTAVDEDVSSPTGMNSSSGINTMIINGGSFTGSVYAQSRSGAIDKKADGFTTTPDYDGVARIVYIDGTMKSGIKCMQTIGYPSGNITYPYNTRTEFFCYDKKTNSINVEGFDIEKIISYGIPTEINPTYSEIDGKAVEVYYYGGKLYLESNVKGSVFVIGNETAYGIFILNNDNLTYYDMGISDAYPEYIGTAIRTSSKAGLRFKTSIDMSAFEGKVTVKEVGTLACFEDNLNQNGLLIDSPKCGQSIAYSKEDLYEHWYEEKDNGEKIFTAVLINFEENEFDRNVAYRPYVIFEYNNTEYTLYGKTVIKSVYGVAKQCTGKDSANEFVQYIIGVVEGSDVDFDHSFFD